MRRKNQNFDVELIVNDQQTQVLVDKIVVLLDFLVNKRLLIKPKTKTKPCKLSWQALI